MSHVARQETQPLDSALTSSGQQRSGREWEALQLVPPPCYSKLLTHGDDLILGKYHPGLSKRRKRCRETLTVELFGFGIQ